MNWHTIFHRLQWILGGISIILILPTIYALFEDVDSTPAYLLPSAFSLILAFLFKRFYHGGGIFRLREGLVFLFLSYVITIFIFAIPIWLIADVSYSEALFESTSGVTTSGATVFEDVESLAAHLQFWRAFIQSIGGLAIILLFLYVPPIIGVTGLQLSRQESLRIQSPGTQFGKKIWGIPQIIFKILFVYISLHILSSIWMVLGGLDLHDAICHSFGIWATAGFSNYNDGWAAFGTPFLEWGAILFMITAGTNILFVVRLHSQNWQNIHNESEWIWYLLAVSLLSVTCAMFLNFEDNFLNFEESLRDGLFQTISMVTNTGIEFESYLNWPVGAQAILFLALFIGACTGSSSSGMRMQQLVVMWKYLYSLSRRVLQPMAIIPIRINGKTVGEDVFQAILGLFGVHLLVSLLGGFLLTILSDLDIFSSWQMVLVCLWNLGTGFGLSHNPALAATLPDVAKVLLMFIMLVGRLELFIVLLLCMPSFWKS
ncbi:MAG: TrkH family potassium uptake protein [bacterium]